MIKSPAEKFGEYLSKIALSGPTLQGFSYDWLLGDEF
jgi:hypothetical protein